MAAKKPKPKKAVKATKAKKTTAAKKKKTPTAGMDAAELKAYQKAAKTVTTNQRIRKNAAAYRQRRLATAKRVTAKQNAAYKSAAASRAVQYATEQTWKQTVSGHQSATLRRAASKRVFNATRIASSRKFTALGIAKHAHQNRMQTVTGKQAVDMERKLSEKAAKKAKVTAAKKVAARKRLIRQGKLPKSGKIPNGEAINAKGKLVRTKKLSKKQLAARKKRSKKGGYSPQAVQAGLKAAKSVQRAQAQSKKKKPVKAKPRKASVLTPRVNSDWVTAGNDLGTENCVAVAIANHLLAWHGMRLSDRQVHFIAGHGGDTIEDALTWLRDADPFPYVHLTQKFELDRAVVGSLIGFETDDGRDHAGVLLDGRVITWGEILPLESVIEEAWYLLWEFHG